MPDSPHEYDDEAYGAAAEELDDAIIALWEAGASTDDIKNEVQNAITRLDT